MNYQGKKVVCLEVSATGYRSGAFRSSIFFMSKEDYDKHEEKLGEYRFWFHELDGKHSQVEGDVAVYHIDEDIGQAYYQVTDGDDKWLDCIRDILPSEDVGALREFNDSIWCGLDETRVVKVQFMGQVIYEE